MDKGLDCSFVWISKQIYYFIRPEILPLVSQLIYCYLQTITILICHEKSLRFLNTIFYDLRHESKGTNLIFSLIADKFNSDLIHSFVKFITNLTLQCSTFRTVDN